MTIRPHRSFLLDKAQPKQQMVTNDNKIEDADKKKRKNQNSNNMVKAIENGEKNQKDR